MARLTKAEATAAAQAKEPPQRPSPVAAAKIAADLSGKPGPKGKQTAKQRESALALEAQKKLDAETAELLEMLQVLGQGATAMIDNLFGSLDTMFEPAYEDIFKRTGIQPMRQRMREDEKQLVAFTIEKAVHKLSPEFIAKYGIWILCGMTTLMIGVPRIIVGVKMEKLCREILTQRAAEQKARNATTKPTSTPSAPGPSAAPSAPVIPGNVDESNAAD